MYFSARPPLSQVPRRRVFILGAHSLLHDPTSLLWEIALVSNQETAIGSLITERRFRDVLNAKSYGLWDPHWSLEWGPESPVLPFCVITVRRSLNKAVHRYVQCYSIIFYGQMGTAKYSTRLFLGSPMAINRAAQHINVIKQCGGAGNSKPLF